MTHPIHFLNIATTAVVGGGIMVVLEPSTGVEHAVTAAFFLLALLAIVGSFGADGGAA